jgi:hypothetical protein
MEERIMKLNRSASILFVTAVLSGCNGESDPAPDYRIAGELPSEIKVLAGAPPSNHFRPVYARRAGVDPASGKDIPVPNAVTLGIGALPAGITAAFNGPAAGRPEFTARLQINVPAGLAVGDYPIAITGAAPPVAPKSDTPYVVKAYDATKGGAFIEVTPSEVSLTPGGPGVVVMATITRIPPYVGAITVTYPGAGSTLPPGVTVAGQTSHTFNIGGAAGDSATRQFIIIANREAAAGHTFPQAEVRTGPAAPGALTDTAAHVVSVQ